MVSGSDLPMNPTSWEWGAFFSGRGGGRRLEVDRVGWVSVTLPDRAGDRCVPGSRARPTERHQLRSASSQNSDDRERPRSRERVAPRRRASAGRRDVDAEGRPPCWKPLAVRWSMNVRRLTRPSRSSTVGARYSELGDGLHEQDRGSTRRRRASGSRPRPSRSCRTRMTDLPLALGCARFAEQVRVPDGAPGALWASAGALKGGGARAWPVGKPTPGQKFAAGLVVVGDHAEDVDERGPRWRGRRPRRATCLALKGLERRAGPSAV